MNSRRSHDLDDDADGLDCFATEIVVIDTADDADGLDCFATDVVVIDPADDADTLDCFGTEGVVFDTVDDADALVATLRTTLIEMLPDVRPAVLPSLRIVVRDAWRRSAHWPGNHATAAVLFLVVCIALWMTPRGTEPVMTVAEASSTQVPPAPPIARPLPEPPIARAVEPPRTAPLAAIARTTTAVVPAPTRPPSAPLGTPAAATAAAPEAGAPFVAPSPMPAPPVIVATPEVVRAEPAPAPDSLSPGAPSPAAASLWAIVAPTDRTSIEDVLRAYRDAYDRLDASSAALIWPRVDTRALTRAFSTLVEQDVSFDRCDLNIVGVKANAKCTGEIRYVQRVGNQTPRVRRLSWQFALERVSDRWQIAQVTAD